MNFKKAYKELLKGKAIFRNDWGYSKKAYIVLIKTKGIQVLFLFNPLDSSLKTLPDHYGFSFNDLESICWESKPKPEVKNPFLPTGGTVRNNPCKAELDKPRLNMDRSFTKAELEAMKRYIEKMKKLKAKPSLYKNLKRISLYLKQKQNNNRCNKQVLVLNRLRRFYLFSLLGGVL